MENDEQHFKIKNVKNCLSKAIRKIDVYAHLSLGCLDI